MLRSGGEALPRSVPFASVSLGRFAGGAAATGFVHRGGGSLGAPAVIILRVNITPFVVVAASLVVGVRVV